MIYEHAFGLLEVPEWLKTEEDYLRFMKYIGIHDCTLEKLKIMFKRLSARQHFLTQQAAPQRFLMSPAANLGALDLSLLLTCRQIYFEARNIPLKRPRCAFVPLPIRPKFLFRRQFSTRVSKLTWVFWWPQAYVDGEEEMKRNANDLSLDISICHPNKRSADDPSFLTVYPSHDLGRKGQETGDIAAGNDATA